jgi:SAM-dependent methyltransferase
MRYQPMKLSTFLKFARFKYLFNNHRGFCPVCGRHSLFILTDTLAMIRNHAICVQCGSVARNRHMALCILDCFREKGIARLSDFGKHPELRVFNSFAFGSINKIMGTHPNILCSEFFTDVRPGEHKDGVLCEDFENLSFEDSTFDLVISEDVFEHLKDYKKGFREVHRVLKKGGVHVFCVPYYFGQNTKALFDFRNGRETPLVPVEYHGDPIQGRIPAYTRFGNDLIGELEGMGYDAALRLSPYEEELKFGTFNCCTFITKKR